MREKKNPLSDEVQKKLPRDRVKSVTGWVVGTSIGFVVSEIVENNVSTDLNKRQTAAKWVGRAALSWAIQTAVQDMINNQIDTLADAYVKAKKELEDKRKSSD